MSRRAHWVPASLVTGKAPGGLLGGGGGSEGFGRKLSEGGLNFLEVALVGGKVPYGILPNPGGPDRPLNAARQLLPLSCRAITLTVGAILKEEKLPSLVGERQFGRHFERQFG